MFLVSGLIRRKKLKNPYTIFFEYKENPFYLDKEKRTFSNYFVFN